MAASIQERLKLKQYQVDTWTTREQLCLASAVMRSGDQNWVAVRRNIKMLTSETSRPPDWYSTKNCALQYARLLERVDTPKRKRERGDGGNETPGEMVTRMLSKQRIEELQVLEAEERATYSQLRREIQQLEGGKLDHQLDTFWEQLVKEQAEEEEREQRQQQWLKEREEKITAIQQALKHQGPKVPQPPHKKKPKLQVGGCVGMAESRRSSGLSETSSEVDSAAESPDQNEVTSESLVSNKSQDESGLVESEPRPTPTSPLLSSLLSKSPITGVPGAASSPLAQLGIGSRMGRGLGISPVSEALQNLVSSAISGTNTVEKDKLTPTTSGTGTSTLSLLLDLPPSTPGGPLPRLSDLPGPSYEQKEHLAAPLKKTEKTEEGCCDKKGCDEQVTVEEIKPSSHEKPTRNIAVTVGAPREAQKEAERDPPVSQKEKRNVEESGEDKRDLCTSHRTCEKKEEGERKESAEQEQQVQKDEGKEEEKEDKEKLQKGEEKHEEEEKSEQKVEDKLQQEHKGIQEEVPDEMQDIPTKTKTTDELTTAKEEPEVEKISSAGVEHGKMQCEESVQEVESISQESGHGIKNEVPSLSQPCMAVTTMTETGQEGYKSTCMPEKEGCKLEMDCEVTENQDKVLEKEENEEEGHQRVEEEDDRVDDVAAADGDAEEEEEREEEEEEIAVEATTRTEVEEEEEGDDEEEEDDEEEDEEDDEDKPATELGGQVREHHTEDKKGKEGESRKTAEKEGGSGKLNHPEDGSISPEMEKEQKMEMTIKEQEDDFHDGQDSKDWVSEEEGSIFGDRKRKISGGDIISSSSPLISYSSPNSPASTHYGDDSENEKAYRSWKKPIMILWNDIAAHKFASLFLRPITDDQAPGYHSIVYRPMDLQKIKRNIESGVIRTTAEFQRDIMLMFLNATMYNTHDHNVYHMAHHMMKDAVSTIQDFLTTQMLVRTEDTPQKSLRRETRESSAKRSDDDSKRKRDPSDEKSLKKRRLN